MQDSTARAFRVGDLENSSAPPKRHYVQCHDLAGRYYMIPRPFGLITPAVLESCIETQVGAAPHEVPMAVYVMHNHAKKHLNHEDAHVLFL